VLIVYGRSITGGGIAACIAVQYTMPISQGVLRENYYIAVVAYLGGRAGPYTADDPATGRPWAFTLTDDGDPTHDNPAIATWDIKSRAAPTRDQLAAAVAEETLAAARVALYPPPAASALSLESLLEQINALKRALEDCSTRVA